MKWAIQNKGSVLITVVAVIFGVMFGLAVHSVYNGAEAVIGGVGNLTASDNPHNFSVTSSGIRASGETRICVFCHTPHRAITDISLLNAPLWNHKLSTELSYTVLSPPVLSNRGNPPGIVNLLSIPLNPPDGASKLCLSCHDGTVAIGDVASEPSPIPMASNEFLTADKLTSGPAYIGPDLTSKHVVSVPMNDQLLTAHLQNCTQGIQTTKLEYPWDTGATNAAAVMLRPTKTQFGGAYGIAASAMSANAPASYKDGYRYGIQCSTCHDPHYWASSTNDTKDGYKFVVLPVSTLCSACHISCT